MRDPMPNPAKTKPDPAIALNKRARYDYFIEESMEAGLALQGWEVKSLRSGRGRITEAYVIVKDGEAWSSARISPLRHSTHCRDSTRTRSSEHRAALTLVGAVERKDRPIPLGLYGRTAGRSEGGLRRAKGTRPARKRKDRDGSVRSRVRTRR